jgi:hypothetical protein
MALKIDRALQAEWEARLAAEGLAPLTAHAAAETRQRSKLTKMTASGEHKDIEAYYDKALKFQRRIELAHAVWSLHAQGMGRREISAFTRVPQKVVRLVLARLQAIARLTPPSWGGT